MISVEKYLKVVGVETNTFTSGTSSRAGRDGHLLLKRNAVCKGEAFSLFNNVLHDGRIDAMRRWLGQATGDGPNGQT